MAASRIQLAERDDEAAATLYVANPDGMFYQNKQRCYLLVQNLHTTDDLLVTIFQQNDCGHAHHREEHGTINKSLSVPSQSNAMLGPFGRAEFNDTNDDVHVGFSFTQEASSDVVGVAALFEPGPGPNYSS